MCPGFGASRQRPRSPNVPPAQALGVIGVAPPAAGAAASGIDSVQPSPSGSTDGVNIVDRARLGGREHVVDGGVLRDLEAVEVGRAASSQLAGLGLARPRRRRRSQVTDEDSVDTSRVSCPSGSCATKNQVR